MRCNATSAAFWICIDLGFLLWFFTDARLWTNEHVSLLATKHLVWWFCSVCTSSRRCAYIRPPTGVHCAGNSINLTINLEGVSLWMGTWVSECWLDTFCFCRHQTTSIAYWLMLFSQSYLQCWPESVRTPDFT